MPDFGLPEPIGKPKFPPPPMSDKLSEVCKRWQRLHSFADRDYSPLKFVQGAIFAARPELRNNPEWQSQAAHSLREVLYPFMSLNNKGLGRNRTKSVLKGHGVVRDPEKTVNQLNTLWVELNEVAHHNSKKKIREFEAILRDFENHLLDALARQSDIHGQINDILSHPPK